MSALQLIGVAAFALNVWGNLLLTTASNRGHIIRLCSNAVWIVYSPLVGAWALLLNHLTFAGINVLGFRRWHRLKVEQKTHELPAPPPVRLREVAEHFWFESRATGRQAPRIDFEQEWTRFCTAKGIR